MTGRLKIFLFFYQIAWSFGLPFLLLYFLYRSYRDPDYRRNLNERFGFGQRVEANVWVHTVSIGELRAVEPLLRSLLTKNETVIVTCITPAARRYGNQMFSKEIEKSQISFQFAPLEFFGAYNRFFKHSKPTLGLIVEQEIWPIMIGSAYIKSVPIYLINSQMTNSGMKKVKWLAMIFGHCCSLATGVFAKSEASAKNFLALGAKNISVVGELRFDQFIPMSHTDAALSFRKSANLFNRPTFVICSMTSDEEDIYIKSLVDVKEKLSKLGVSAPLFILVPRAIERFDKVLKKLGRAGLRSVIRSEAFSKDLVSLKEIDWDEMDVLLGDSFGEMFFYMGLAETAIVGGGFNPSGAHNIIEPLMLDLNTLVGPHIWTILFPVREAEAAGLVTVVADQPSLVREMLKTYNSDIILDKRDRFFAIYSGATQKTLNILFEQGCLKILKNETIRK
tara:strand:+ start:3237 stop:4583 length:1347 start_codon:yes stop_codon:yes gene_type:complete